jgi:hypothetical protein
MLDDGSAPAMRARLNALVGQSGAAGNVSHP